MVASANRVNDVGEVNHSIGALARVLFAVIELDNRNAFDILVLDVVHHRLSWSLSE